ncbi:MAG TPA: hypothetical protein VIV61_03505 [Candidatus Ozemobacteraceae bacterium]
MRCNEAGGRFRPGSAAQGLQGLQFDSGRDLPEDAPAEPLHLVCFDDAERKTILAGLKGPVERELPGSRFPLVTGRLDGHEATLLRLPFGDKPALLLDVARAHLAAVRPGLVVALGSGMAFHDDLRPGDVLATRVALHGTERIEIPRPPEFEALRRGVPRRIRFREGAALTVPTFVGSGDERQNLRDRFPTADMAEMEDFHLARLYRDAGIGFISLRGITDYGDFGVHLENLRLSIGNTLLLVRRMLRQTMMDRRLAFIPNASTLDMPYNIMIYTPGRPLSLPDAVRLSGTAIRGFALGRILPDGARLDIVIDDTAPLGRWVSAPGGRAAVVETAGWIFVASSDSRHARLILRQEALSAPPGAVLDRILRDTPVTVVPEPGPDPRGVGLPPLGGVHVQGLNSISAEPEEGLLAATTLEECLENGMPVVDSNEARIWVYRTANADEASYFDPPYELPMRIPGPPAPGTCLIATGLGPAIAPEAAGGSMADTLMLGDEQGGRLVSYLEDLCGEPFGADEVFRYPGVAQRLAADRAALSRIDRRALLTLAGLNALRFDPATLRRIYSPAYDRFFRGYFAPRRETPARLSFLILSSRGCGNRCSICCSGGYQPFTALRPELVIDLLKRIRDTAALAPGEFVDVFFLDSYFNRDPDRIVKLARGITGEGLRPWFEFYVRHSGLSGFLRRRAPGLPGTVRDDLVTAYRELGIDEIVMGIDSFTDESIRLLKTDTLRLALEGEQAHPAYTFDEIRAVLTAIEEAGMASRCFLLMNNPFVGDDDRIRTYYHLALLALTLRRFRIDLESSSRVNELKPFPGAPLARVAGRIDGIIRNDRFVYRSGLGHIETWLEFERFGERRETPASRHRFLVSCQESRARLIGRVLMLLKHSPGVATRETGEVIRVAEALLGLEQLLKPVMGPWLEEFRDRREAERFLRVSAEELAAAFARCSTDRAVRETPSRSFFRHLHDEYAGCEG